LTNKPTEGGEQAVGRTLECPGEVIDFENHASLSQDHLPGTDRRASSTENDVMSMTRLLILAKNIHHSKDILNDHIISRRQVGRESPALSVPAVIGIRIAQRSVSGQGHASSFQGGGVHSDGSAGTSSFAWTPPRYRPRKDPAGIRVPCLLNGTAISPISW
jgi:hypothetical protein